MSETVSDTAKVTFINKREKEGVGPDRYMTILEHRAYLLRYIGTNYFGTCQGPFRNIGSYDFGTHTGQNMDNFGTPISVHCHICEPILTSHVTG